MPRPSRAKQLTTILRGLTRHQARSSSGPDPFLRHDATNPLGKLERARDRAYRLAADAYARRLVPQDADATLIVANRRVLADPLADRACGWRNVAPRIDVHSIDAEHLELLEEPWVAEVAAIFRSRLRGAGRDDMEHR